jgi:hypothetical protein
VLRGPRIERVLRKCVLKENAFDETSKAKMEEKRFGEKEGFV